MHLRTALDVIQWATSDTERLPLVCDGAHHQFTVALCNVITSVDLSKWPLLCYPQPEAESPIDFSAWMDFKCVSDLLRNVRGAPRTSSSSSSSTSSHSSLSSSPYPLSIVPAPCSRERPIAPDLPSPPPIVYTSFKSRVSIVCKTLHAMQERAAVLTVHLPGFVIQMLRCLDHRLVGYQCVSDWSPSLLRSAAALCGVSIQLPDDKSVPTDPPMLSGLSSLLLLPPPSSSSSTSTRSSLSPPLSVPLLNPRGAAYVIYSMGITELSRLGVRHQAFDGLLDQFTTQILSGARVGAEDYPAVREMSGFKSVSREMGEVYNTMRTAAANVDSQLRGHSATTPQFDDAVRYALRFQLIASNVNHPLTNTIKEGGREISVSGATLVSKEKFIDLLLYHQYLSLVDDALKRSDDDWVFMTINSHANNVSLPLLRLLGPNSLASYSVAGACASNGQSTTLLSITKSAWAVYRVLGGLLYTLPLTRRPGHKSPAWTDCARRGEMWYRMSSVPHIAQLAKSSNIDTCIVGVGIVREWLGLKAIELEDEQLGVERKTLDPKDDDLLMAARHRNHSLRSRAGLALERLKSLALGAHNIVHIVHPLFAIHPSDALQCSADGYNDLIQVEANIYPPSARSLDLWNRLCDAYSLYPTDPGTLLRLAGHFSFVSTVETNSTRIEIPDLEGRHIHDEDFVRRQKENTKRNHPVPGVPCSSACECSSNSGWDNLMTLLHVLEARRFGRPDDTRPWQQINVLGNESKSFLSAQIPSQCLSTVSFPVGMRLGGDGAPTCVYGTDQFYVWKPVFTAEIAVGDRWLEYYQQWAGRCKPTIFGGYNQKQRKIANKRVESNPSSIDDDEDVLSTGFAASPSSEKKTRTNHVGGGLSLLGRHGGSLSMTTTVSFDPRRAQPKTMHTPAPSVPKSTSSSSSSNSSSSSSSSVPFNPYGSHTGSSALPLSFLNFANRTDGTSSVQ